MLRVLVFSLLVIFSGVLGSSLELVSDDDLLNHIKNENFVVALFTKKDCDACENMENELIQVREDLVDSLSAWVVKVVNSQLLRLYSPNKEPVLVYFRNGNPLLYDGPLDGEEILRTFIDNQKPIVKELTDDTFEHLTQASSGATTGDWFVMFYSTDCIECQRMGARWETVGSKIKQRVNVARMNKHSSTARRFNVFEVPEFIFFRQGKMYRYQIPKYDVNSFVSFARDWYRNARAEKVPVPQSPFDDFTQMIANALRENPWIIKLGSITIGVFVIVSVASKLRRKSEAPQKKAK